MTQMWARRTRGRIAVMAALFLILCPGIARAAAPLPENPQSGSVGVQGSISSPPPKTAPTIATPSSGQGFSSIPITISGLCTAGLLVKVFSNNVFIGSAMCVNGSYSIKADLFSGRNDLTAKQFDALGQESPVSNTVSVTFNDAQFLQFGTHVSLNSDYAKRGADPGDTLTWPVSISGGAAPYAVSVDWGDGKPADLMSRPYPGAFNLAHVYQTAGTYSIIVKAVDKNGGAAFLQLVGVGNGEATQQQSGKSSGGTTVTKTKVLWTPAAVLLALTVVSFWLGRRHELTSLRKRIEQSRS